MNITQAAFGQIFDGRVVEKTTLTNSHGHRVALMNWGASLLEVDVPDRSGELANVNCTFTDLDPYLRPHPGFGSSIGRFCNRIAFGRFTIDGVDHQVTVNHGEHCLHGGNVNFSHLYWETVHSDQERIDGVPTAVVRYRLVSPDGDEGFPGEVTAHVEYRWNDRDELTIEYSATTDAPTHVNLTNHAYWNLAGVGSGTALDHIAVIHANEVLSVDGDLIPTGATESVDGTPFDFLHAETFRKRIAELSATNGYDHCYVVAGKSGTLRPAARVTSPESGRFMEVETTQPGMQLYLGNHLSGNEASAGVGQHEAFCLETQHYPDAPNHPDFPSTLLRPGQTMRETTVHRFGVEGKG